MATGSNAPQPAPSKRRLSASRIVIVALIAAGFVTFFALGLQNYLSFHALQENRQALLRWNESRPFVAALTYMGVYALAVAFSVPGAAWLTIAGGFVFGWFYGTCYTVIGATVGACAIFLAARYAFADFFHAKAGPALKRMEKGFREDAASYLLFLRLVPAFPFWLVNLAPAFFGMPLGAYALWTFIGIIPGTLVYVLVGNGLSDYIARGQQPDLGIIFEPQYLAPILGLAALSLLPIVVKRLKRGSRLSEAAEDADAEKP